jgi:uncharacterized protein (TIGR02246 family)
MTTHHFAHDDDTQVCALFQQMLDGWNHEDATAFAAPFSDDATFIAFDGTQLIGRQSVQDFHEPLFRTHLKGMRLFGRIEALHRLADDIGFVRAVGSTSNAGGKNPAPQRDSVQTLTVVKRDGEWRFTAFQNTRVRPIRTASSFVAWMLADGAWKLLSGRGRSILQPSAGQG